MRDFFQPFLGERGVGTVLQLYIAFAPGPGVPDFLEGKGLSVIIDGDIQREPLLFFVAGDLGRDFRLRGAHFIA